MKYNEETAELRRIPVYLQNSAGVPITGALPTPGQIQISLSGGALANGGGLWVEDALGCYYYQCTQLETVTDSYVFLLVTATGAIAYPYAVDIGARIEINEPDASARRMPIWLAVAGLTLTGAEVKIGINGGALANAAGTTGETGSGAYYYELPLTEIASIGYRVLRVADAAAATYIYGFDVIPSTAYPVLTTATTAESIRDRILTVIEALVPSINSQDRFRRYRNEGDAGFTAWCESNPVAAFRRVQVRDTGDDEPPAVSNTDIERREIVFRILVAYPQTNRTGRQAALDRDDAMSADQHQIERAIGMTGRANFSGAYPDACWLRGTTARVVEDGIDMLEIVQTMMFSKQQL